MDNLNANRTQATAPVGRSTADPEPTREQEPERPLDPFNGTSYYSWKGSPSADDWFKDFEKFRRPLDGYSDDSNQARIAILDTGVDMSLIPEDFKENIKGKQSFLRDTNPSDATDSDSGRHGSHIARLVLKLAHWADIYIARIKKDNTTPMEPDSIAKALKHAVDKWDVHIISMSWGFDKAHEGIEFEILRAYEKKKIMFVAASNRGANSPKNSKTPFPAKMREVICINSCSGFGKYSDFNPEPREEDFNFATLGEAVLTSNQSEERLSGTSFATPIAAAIAAVFIEFAMQKDNQHDITIRDGVITRDGMIKLFVAMSHRRVQGFRWLQPWHLIVCEHRQSKHTCKSCRSEAAETIRKVLQGELPSPKSLGDTAPIPKLPHIAKAEFGSEHHERKAECCFNTRVHIRNEIKAWARNPGEKPICWLTGSAGTGKSTIARSMALTFDIQGILGASFFLDTNLRDVSKFITSLAHQLAKHSAPLAKAISAAIAKDEDLLERAKSTQWQELICKPLSNLDTDSSAIIIVIDALDECENDNDIEDILALLTETWRQRNVPLRILLTTRVGTYRQGMRKENLHSVVLPIELDTVDEDVVRQDISEFIRWRIGNIKMEMKMSLPVELLDDKTVNALTRRAGRLFIYAAVACSYIAGQDRKGNRSTSTMSRLNQVLNDAGFNTLDKMYDQILNQAAMSEDTEETNQLIKQLQSILRVILDLKEPMPAKFIATLIEPMPVTNFEDALDIVYNRLDSLRSVLVVPESGDDPVEIFHHSFRTFLLKRLVNEKAAHQALFERGLWLMSKNPETRLKKNICRECQPGIDIGRIRPETISRFIPRELEYACRHWAEHLGMLDSSQRGAALLDDGKLHSFLKKHFLHWLEALSLIRSISNGVAAVTKLQEFVMATSNESQLLTLVQDARRFLLRNRGLIENAPLQAYVSALIFSPAKCLTRALFKHEEPTWITKKPSTEDNWSACLQTLEGHSCSVESVAFSPHDKHLASGGGTIKIWNTTTGQCIRTLEGYTDSIKSIAFLPDGKHLVWASGDIVVTIWYAAWASGISNNEPVALRYTTTANYIETSEFHTRSVKSIAFSLNGKFVASASDDETIKIWDATTGKYIQTLRSCSSSIHSVVFSPDSELIASASDNKTVQIWNAVTGQCLETVKEQNSSESPVIFLADRKRLMWRSDPEHSTTKFWNHDTGQCEISEGRGLFNSSVAFSPDGGRLTWQLQGRPVMIWDATTCQCIQMLGEHFDQYSSPAFSPDGNHLVWKSVKDVKIGNIITGRYMTVPKIHSYSIESVTFLPDSKHIALVLVDGTVEISDVHTGRHIQTLEGQKGQIDSMKLITFSPNGELLASTSYSSSIRIWDASTGRHIQTFEEHRGAVQSLAFSPDSTTLASGSFDMTVKIWDTTTARHIKPIKEHSGEVSSIVFSPDGKYLASAALYDRTVIIWDARTGQYIRSLEGPKFYGWSSGATTLVAFSPDSRHFVCASTPSMDQLITIWNVATWEHVKILEDGRDIGSVVFSHDGWHLALAGSYDETVMIWDISTGLVIQELVSKNLANWKFGPPKSDICSLAFSPDSSNLALGLKNGMIELWNIVEGECVRTFEGHSGMISSVTFSPDGRYLVSARYKSITIWDAALGTPLCTQKSAYQMGNISFDPIDSSLLTDIGRLKWNLLPDELAMAGNWDQILQEPSWCGYGLNSDRTWINYNGKNVLRLPPEYQRSRSAVLGLTVAIGCSLGRVLIICFSPNILPVYTRLGIL